MVTVRAGLITALGLTLCSTAPGQDYTTLQSTLLRFYRYQRAGTAIGNPFNPFYTRTPYPHASDAYAGHPLDGGWYDAGDFVKFGLNLGFSTYCLLKGYDVFPGAYDDLTSRSLGQPNGIPDILDEVRVATDYIIKAIISDSYIVRDVGDANSDHAVWASGYDHRQARTVYQAEGADIPGMHAASLALMARLYRPYDTAYAATCLSKARQAFAWCTRNQKLSSMQYDYGGMPFYECKTWKDKMACGAVELYRTTGEGHYLTWAADLMTGIAQHYDAPGFANCGDFAAFELYRLGRREFSESWFADLALAQRRVVNAPGSLVHGAFVNTNWGVCAGAGNAAFSAALAYMVTGVNAYRDFAFQQINWLAGFPPFTRSWIVRFGNGPTHPHHRNDDCLNIAGVDLIGGVVSGPTTQGVGTFDADRAATYTWVFNDVVSEYRNTEVAINYNAGAVGATAFIRYYNNPPPGLVRIEEALRCTPDLIDFNTGNAVVTVRFERSVSWKIVLSGRTSGAVRTFTGTGQTVSQAWSGESDNGRAAFMTGELVDLRLGMSGIAEYHQARAAAVACIASLKDTPFLAADVLVDDFDDGDLVNKFAGAWRGFSDSSEGTQGGASPAPVIYPVTTGKNGTRAINFRLTAQPGAQHPYAGVRTLFNAAGTPVSLGPAVAVAFDVQAAADSARLRVELEQTTISGGAYHGSEIRLFGQSWARVRVPFNVFAQPSWVTRPVALNTGAVTALRFTLHGEGSVRLTLDNVHIEGLSLGAALVRAGMPPPTGTTAGLRVRVQDGAVVCVPERDWPPDIVCTVVNPGGASVRTAVCGPLQAGQPAAVAGPTVPGLYVMQFTSAAAARSVTVPFIVPAR